MKNKTITSDRLRLVLPEAGHLAAYTAYCGSERSAFVGGPYDPVKAFEKFSAMAGHWTLRGFGRYVITLRSTGQAIGHVGALQLDSADLSEMTWTLWDGACEGQGYATEAALAYLQHAAKDLPVDRMLIRIDRDNRRSRALAERIGGALDQTAVPPTWMPKAVTYRLTL